MNFQYKTQITKGGNKRMADLTKQNTQSKHQCNRKGYCFADQKSEDTYNEILKCINNLKEYSVLTSKRRLIGGARVSEATELHEKLQEAFNELDFDKYTSIKFNYKLTLSTSENTTLKAEISDSSAESLIDSIKLVRKYVKSSKDTINLDWVMTICEPTLEYKIEVEKQAIESGKSGAKVKDLVFSEKAVILN